MRIVSSLLAAILAAAAAAAPPSRDAAWEALMERAGELAQGGEYAAAASAAREALAVAEKTFGPKDKKTIKSLGGLGKFSWMGREFETSKAAEKRLEGVTPRSFSVLVQLGRLYRVEGRNRDAERILTAALRREPGSARIHAELGMIRRDMGKLGAAADSLREARRLDPGSFWIRMELAKTLSAGGDREGARKARAAARIAANTDVESYIREGYALLARGRSREAKRDFEKLLSNESTRPMGYHHLASYYQDKGLCSLALDYLREALFAWKSMSHPSRTEIAHAWERIAEVLRLQGRMSESEAAIRRIIAMRDRVRFYPWIFNAKRHLAHNLAAQGRLADSAVVFRRLIDDLKKETGVPLPKRRSVEADLAAVLLRAGKRSESEKISRRLLGSAEAIARAEKRAGQGAHFLLRLANLNRALGEFVAAEGLYRRVLLTEDRAPASKSAVSAAISLAEMSEEAGRSSEAERYYRRALEDPEMTSGHRARERTARSGLIGLLEEKGRGTRAEIPAGRSPAGWYLRCFPAAGEWAGIGRDARLLEEAILSLKHLAERRIDRGDGPEAARMARRAREFWDAWDKEDKAKAAGAAAIGDLYAALGDLKEAESLHREAAALGKKLSFPEYVGRSSGRLRLIRLIERPGSQNEESAAARGEMAFLLRTAEGLSARGRHDQAARAAVMALREADRELRPGDPLTVTAVSRLARIDWAANKTAETARLAQRLRAVEPKSYSLFLEAGRISLLAEELPEAEAMFIEASKLAPRPAEAHAELGELYLRTGRFPEAAQSFKEALAAKPRSYWLHARLAEAYQRAGRFDEAKRALKTARKTAGADAGRLIDLGYASLDLEDFPGAKAALEEAVETDPSGFRGLHHLATYYSKLGIYDKAEACLKEALAALKLKKAPSPDETAHTMFNLARVHADQKQFVKAEYLFGEVIAMAGELSDVKFPADSLRRLAGIRLAQGRLAESEVLCGKARAALKGELRRHPRLYFEISANMALIRTRQGKRAEAEAAARRLLTFWSETMASGPRKDMARSLLSLGDLFKELGDLEQAQSLYARLIAVGETTPVHNPVMGALIGMAEIRRSTGGYAEAEKYLRKALAIGKTRPVNRKWTGLAEKRLDALRAAPR